MPWCTLKELTAALISLVSWVVLHLSPAALSEMGILPANIELPIDAIADFCQRWQVVELSLFGSALRDDFRPDSDIDVMVQFHADARIRFSQLDAMELELQKILHRDVDLVTRQGIESSRNYLRRHEILSSAQVIYAAGSSIPT
jgi:predicted nucleotidyltransferase